MGWGQLLPSRYLDELIAPKLHTFNLVQILFETTKVPPSIRVPSIRQKFQLECSAFIT